MQFDHLRIMQLFSEEFQRLTLIFSNSECTFEITIIKPLRFQEATLAVSVQLLISITQSMTARAHKILGTFSTTFYSIVEIQEIKIFFINLIFMLSLLSLRSQCTVDSVIDDLLFANHCTTLCGGNTRRFATLSSSSLQLLLLIEISAISTTI